MGQGLGARTRLLFSLMCNKLKHTHLTRSSSSNSVRGSGGCGRTKAVIESISAPSRLPLPVYVIDTAARVSPPVGRGPSDQDDTVHDLPDGASTYFDSFCLDFDGRTAARHGTPTLNRLRPIAVSNALPHPPTSGRGSQQYHTHERDISASVSFGIIRKLSLYHRLYSIDET